MLKFPQGFVGLSAQAIEQCRRRNRAPLCRIQRARKLLYGRTRRVQARRLLSGTLSIRQRFLPRARLVEVVGQVRQVGGGGLQGRYIETLHCVSNTAVQSLALAYQ